MYVHIYISYTLYTLKKFPNIFKTVILELNKKSYYLRLPRQIKTSKILQSLQNLEMRENIQGKEAN